VFRAAAVFAGGGTVAALEAVAGGREGDALEALASLVDKSLLGPEVAAGQPRLGMLETIREFALEQLEERGEAAGVRRRHAAYYLALAPADRPQPPLANRNVLEGLDRLEADLGNYRDALSWFLAHGEGERALRLALALFPIWEDGGRLREGARWLERALAAGGRAPAALRAEGARCLALLVTPQGDYDRAARLRRRALGLYRALGDAAGVAAVLMAQGLTARSRTDYAGARRCFEESLALLTRLGHAAEGARCRAWLGAVARGEGRYARARAYLEDSLAASHRLARSADAAGAAGEVAPFRCLETGIWAAP